MPTDNKAAFWERWIKALVAAYNEGKIDALDEFLAPDYVHHSPPFANYDSPAAYKKYIEAVRSGYPDVQLTYNGWIAQGDTCAAWGTWRGTKAGSSVLASASGTGQKLNFVLAVICRAVGGKIVEQTSYLDSLTYAQQLGLVPPLEKK